MRLDYNINSSHRLTARLLFDHYTLTDPYGTFIGGNLPTVPTDRNRPGRNIQAEPLLDDQVEPDERGQVQLLGQHARRSSPVGDAWARATYGFAVPADLPGGGTYEDASRTRSISGYAGWSSANAALVSPTQDFAFTDTVTWLRGNHTVKAGGLYVFNTKKQNGRSNYTGYGQLQHQRQHQDARATPSPTRCSATSAPTARRSSTRWATSTSSSSRRSPPTTGSISDNLSIEFGVRYTLPLPDLHGRQQPDELRPEPLRPRQRRHGEHQRHDRPGSGDRYNGLDPARRGARPTRSANVPERRLARGAGDPDRRPPGHLQPAAPVHAALQLRLDARRPRARPPSAAASASSTTAPRATSTSRCRTTRRSPSARRTRTATSATPAAARPRRSRPGAQIDSLDPNLGDPAQLELEPQRPARARCGASSARWRTSARRARTCCASPTSTSPRSRTSRRTRPGRSTTPTTCARTRATRTSACA